ncbi:MAG TPA: NAD(P)(+) transhydrogenase (Re/Si-specific) subunit alpha, partial [Acidobacteriota bacterium]|nr:NAD(P)(+) transhydrogenase (Re/Si-specific) subunit alpha [Acidobacteriota bacterium]
MLLAVPKEIMEGEGRVAATPETVTRYLELGFEVVVETGAGTGAFISDQAYQEAGAKTVSGPEVLYGRADVILKVKQPVENRRLGRHEVDLMKEGAMLVAF